MKKIKKKNSAINESYSFLGVFQLPAGSVEEGSEYKTCVHFFALFFIISLLRDTL